MQSIAISDYREVRLKNESGCTNPILFDDAFSISNRYRFVNQANIKNDLSFLETLPPRGNASYARNNTFDTE